MAPKRKASSMEEVQSPAAKKGRPKKAAETASSSRPRRSSNTVAVAAEPSRSTRSSVNETPARDDKSKKGLAVKKAATASAKKPVPEAVKANSKRAKTSKPASNGNDEGEDNGKDDSNGGNQSNLLSINVSVKKKHSQEAAEHEDVDPHEPSYWLMKAEPESRIEKGKDVKFSIDDLKAATEPEAWDGVRNAVARNNMRTMMKGDMVFFYHSNCKVPGIVGTMEIVREHSVDESAFDPEHPYYDAKSDREKPKWCVVHVEFRQKFPEMIKLKELQSYARDGGVLEHLQTLKQSRLSVSKVTKKEWDFIMGLVDMEDVAAASAQHKPQMAD